MENQRKTSQHNPNNKRWNFSNSNNLHRFKEQFEHKLEEDETARSNYKIFTKCLKDTAERTCGKTRGNKNSKNIRPRWFTQQAREAIEKRKQANRKHRKARKTNDSTKEELWNIYKNLKKEAKKIITRSIRTVDKKMEQELRKGGIESTKKFWRYLKKKRKPEEEAEGLINKKGEIERNKNQIADLLKQYYEEPESKEKDEIKHEEQVNNPNINDHSKETLLRRMDEEEIRKTISTLPIGKAVGKDDIPNELIKNLGPTGITTITNMLNNIWQGIEPVPESWKDSSIKLIYKGKGKDKNNLNNYRPIALLSNIYKLYTKVIKNRLNNFLETNELLGDMQNGFRKNRGVPDCLFILTQLIETAFRRNKQLYVAFIDIKGAYDNIQRQVLWNRMKELGIPEELVNHITELYKNTSSTYQWNNIISEPIYNHKGVKQGCPLSSTLFTIYLKKLEEMLQEGNAGVIVGEDKNNYKTFTCNGIFYADDTTIFADTAENLQKQLDTTTEFGKKSELTYCKEKSEILIFNDNPQEEKSFKLQDIIIPKKEHTNYLGTNISTNKHYLENTEIKKVEKAKKLKGITKSSSRLSFNKAIVARTLWKQVAVPSLTYGSEVLCLSTETTKELDREQTQLGMYAVGGNYISPHSSVEGEMGWSPFEAREAKSKNKFLGKLVRTEDKYMVKKIYKYTTNTTQWQKRTWHLRRKYNLHLTNHIQNTKEKWNKEVNKLTNCKNEDRWKKEIAKKQSLKMYGVKEKPKWEGIYDNTLGSDLLFQARTNSLPTRAREATIYGSISPKCTQCNQADENIEHILTQCSALDRERAEIYKVFDTPTGENEVDRTVKWLGLKNPKTYTEQKIEAVKNFLESWWWKTKKRYPYWRR